MKWLLIIVGSLIALGVILWLIGSLLPKDHVASRMARYNQPPEKIWEVITNVDAMTTWRKDLKSLKRLPDKNGFPAWVEDMNGMEIPLEVTESQPPRKLVTKIAGDELAFGGTWTYEIAVANGGATLRITERGEIYNSFFRLMARFVFGYTSTMEGYLTSLGKKLGEDVSPQP
ncbi:MAG: SRPBCC family protein [Acidobacteria bacterium]|nr:SRPBCC family protein [Acidobacteriota bacterium]